MHGLDMARGMKSVCLNRASNKTAKKEMAVRAGIRVQEMGDRICRARIRAPDSTGEEVVACMHRASSRTVNKTMRVKARTRATGTIRALASVPRMRGAPPGHNPQPGNPQPTSRAAQPDFQEIRRDRTGRLHRKLESRPGPK